MKISSSVRKYERPSQPANYEISTTFEREFESGTVSRETQCEEPRHFDGPGALVLHRVIIDSEGSLFVGNVWMEVSSLWSRRRKRLKKGRRETVAEWGKVGRRESRKKWKAWKWVAKRSAERIFYGNVGTLRVFLPVTARGTGASGCRVSAASYRSTSARKKIYKKGRRVLKRQKRAKEKLRATR